MKLMNKLLVVGEAPEEIITLMLEGEKGSTKSKKKAEYNKLYNEYLKKVDNSKVDFTGNLLKNLKRA